MLEVGVVVVLAVIWLVYLRMTGSGMRMPGRRSATAGPVDRERFMCKIDRSQIEYNGSFVPGLVIKMRGQLRVPHNNCDTDVQAIAFDVTEGQNNAHPVLSILPQWQMEDSPAFCLLAHNGRVPRKISVLANWVTIGSIPCSVLKFPRQGQRQLKFVISLLNRSSEKELLSTATTFPYDNHEAGYIDLRESFQKVEGMMIQLAVAAAMEEQGPSDKGLFAIREWIEKRNQGVSGAPDSREKSVRLLAALDQAVQRAMQEDFDAEAICRSLAQNASIVDRYNTIRLVLRVVAAEGNVDRDQTDQLTRVAELLKIDRDKFRALAQKSLPINTHCIEDIRFLLGITETMPSEEIRRRLNEEYQKWNGRVTHPDQEIRTQADRMLALIAEARNRFVEQSWNVPAAS
ncbi:MAG: TerB family tellurite resistance protein [Sedimentisphaerales bacterium]|nr:TerB family tellurite resistance protein [Sedimentisphaerales bacterium]